jgi:hypothetical protein
MLKVEKIFREVQHSRSLLFAFGSRRVVDAHEPIRKGMRRILENMVHVPLVTEEVTDDAHR